MTTTNPETTQVLLLASSDHNLDVLRPLLRNNTPNVQDPTTGYTPLHSAIASCTSTSPAEDIDLAEKTLRLLLQNGAIWNTLDNNNETPGCVALRLKLTSLYEIMVDAGVRAELLLGRLDGYMALSDGDDEEEDEELEEGIEVEEEGAEDGQEGEKEVDGDASTTATTLTTNGHERIDPVVKKDVNSEDYLKSDLQHDGDKIVDSDQNAVMMQWESSIMSLTASLLLPKPSLRVLNVGFGMGSIDTFLSSHSPSAQHIIEAHPSVLSSPVLSSFLSSHSSTTTLHRGRWQDVCPDLIAQGVTFDAIYFDTFAEDYTQLKYFFDEMVVGLLDSGGRFGFFHGLGADRQICYDVYTKVVEMDLMEAGFETEWRSMNVPKLGEEEWKGVRRKYWVLDEYKLPICKFIE